MIKHRDIIRVLPVLFNTMILMVLPLLFEDIFSQGHGLLWKFFVGFVALGLPSYFCLRNVMIGLVPPERVRDHPASNPNTGLMALTIELGGVRGAVFSIAIDIGYLALQYYEAWLFLKWVLKDVGYIQGEWLLYAIVGFFIIFLGVATWLANRAIKYGFKYRAFIRGNDIV